LGIHPAASFDELIVHYSIQGIVVNKTPLRVGVGRSQKLTSSVDNPVLMMRRESGEEVPVIPGSSWKGLLRSEAEKFVRSSESPNPDWRDIWKACDIFELTENEELRAEHSDNPCVICRLFGNTELASHVRLFDSYPANDYTLSIIDRVAIDRVTGGQSPGRLFSVQVVAPMTKWSFEMHVINIDLRTESPEGRVLSYLFRRLIMGLQIGGGKSVGYGLVQLMEDGLRVKEIRVEKGDLSLKDYTGSEALKILGVRG